VAEEIRKLADDSKNAVTEIQSVTSMVLNSVGNLAAHSNQLLQFMDTDVAKDYETMLGAADEYQKDAEFVDDLVTDFSATSEELSASIQNMMKAIGEITAAANEGAEGTANIAERTTAVAEKSGEVIRQANISKESSDSLLSIVSKFMI